MELTGARWFLKFNPICQLVVVRALKLERPLLSGEISATLCNSWLRLNRYSEQVLPAHSRGARITARYSPTCQSNLVLIFARAALVICVSYALLRLTFIVAQPAAIAPRGRRINTGLLLQSQIFTSAPAEWCCRCLLLARITAA